MKIVVVAAARPNFMKVAPLLRAFSCDVVLVHTGQHYDYNMSASFFSELGISDPDYHLEVGKAGSSLAQISATLVAFEQVCLEEQPDCVVVVGDVNATLACALVASQLQIPLAHVEAGLRSFDRSMPEEVNRVAVDHLADFLFVTEQSGVDNLATEGVAAEKIHLVGNVMIDTLVVNMSKFVSSERPPYAVLTLHRPSNVDSLEDLQRSLAIISAVQEKIPVVYPLHPRTKKSLEKHELMDRLTSLAHVEILEPQSYFSFMGLVTGATFVLTDSGGIQEETSYLGVPCVTLRENTERPVTLELGTNYLVGVDAEKVLFAVDEILSGSARKKQKIPLWDGKTSERIVKILEDSLPRQ